MRVVYTKVCIGLGFWPIMSCKVGTRNKVKLSKGSHGACSGLVWYTVQLT